MKARIPLTLLCLAEIAGCGYTSNLSSAVQQSAPPPGKIQHVVVIFQENVSFDHYFATYPKAQNLPGEQAFEAAAGTPSVDGLSGALMIDNPNASNPMNGAGAANPFRLSPKEAATADQDHSYRAEQLAFHTGAMDLFPRSVGGADGPNLGQGIAATTGLTMGYYDGNTVTALWNYAQHYAMSDRFFGTTFGPSAMGALNLISGQTNGAVNDVNALATMVPDGGGGYTLITNANPEGDTCGGENVNVHMTGKNVGDLLNAAGLSWGWFAEGFDLSVRNSNGTSGCRRSNRSEITQFERPDYTPFIEPFQYYPSTANPAHRRPPSVSSVGWDRDSATHHQYDLHDFFDAAKAGNFPAVSFLKSAAYRDGHAGYSDPLDEQAFLVETINKIQQNPEWKHTVIFITYDDSDGWYDHVHNVVNGSASPLDGFTSPGVCGDVSSALAGVNPATQHASGRCGYGPRLPLLVISPWAKANYVSHVVTDQTSILRFIEDTFLGGQRIGQGSYDEIAGSLVDMFDFSGSEPANAPVVLLNARTGLMDSGK
jgi:phospholipase C